MTYRSDIRLGFRHSIGSGLRSSPIDLGKERRLTFSSQRPVTKPRSHQIVQIPTYCSFFLTVHFSFFGWTSLQRADVTARAHPLTFVTRAPEVALAKKTSKESSATAVHQDCCSSLRACHVTVTRVG